MLMKGAVFLSACLYFLFLFWIDLDLALATLVLARISVDLIIQLPYYLPNKRSHPVVLPGSLAIDDSLRQCT